MCHKCGKNTRRNTVQGPVGPAGPAGQTGQNGPAGAPSSGSSVLTFNTGAFTFFNPVFVSNLLSGSTPNFWFIGQTAALSPSDTLIATLNAARNSFCITAPRAGTLASFYGNLYVFFQGDASQLWTPILSLSSLLRPPLQWPVPMISSPPVLPSVLPFLQALRH